MHASFVDVGFSTKGIGSHVDKAPILSSIAVWQDVLLFARAVWTADVPCAHKSVHNEPTFGTEVMTSVDNVVAKRAEGQRGTCSSIASREFSGNLAHLYVRAPWHGLRFVSGGAAVLLVCLLGC